ncbi:MAG TPA: anti-sigma factor [Polyangiaceae bacterium]|nr:anti-sigma factor [Polyangiaceae bacterium]
MSTSRSTKEGGQGRPTDMELMLYIDGELDGELDDARRAEIEAHLEQSESGWRKMTALRIGSGMVREHALASAKDFDIASSIMAKIDAVAVDPPAKSPAKKDSAGAEVIDIGARRPTAVDRPKAANDNSRSIFTLAAVAVAAAAALMIWGKMGADPGRSADSAPVTAQEAPVIPAPPEEKPPAPPAESASAESESEHGVEVAAVDFGAHMGSIFYVPTDAVAGATTTVVWVDE